MTIATILILVNDFRLVDVLIEILSSESARIIGASSEIELRSTMKDPEVQAVVIAAAYGFRGQQRVQSIIQELRPDVRILIQNTPKESFTSLVASAIQGFSKKGMVAPPT